MERWLLSFCLGAILSLFTPIVPVIFYKTVLLLLIAAFIFVKNVRGIIAFVLGMTWLLFHAHQVENVWSQNNIEPSKVWGRAHQLVVKIDSIVEMKAENKSQIFYADIIKLSEQKLKYPVRVRLSWHVKNLKNNANTMQQGQVVSLHAKLKPSRNFANTGTFNYKKWLLSKGIVTTGYVINDNVNVLSSDINLRQQWYTEYKGLLTSQPLSSLFLALTFGERSLFSQNTWQVLQQTGTQHLIAISGLHIGLVAAFAYFLLKSLVRILPLYRYYLSVKSLNSMNLQPLILIGTIGTAVFYAYLANFSVPTVRALLMLSVLVGAKLLHVHITLTRTILLCFFVIVLCLPMSLLTVSFWLTFYAVIIIVFTLWRFKPKQQGRAYWRHYVITLVKIQFAISILMLPINLVVFGQLSAVSLLANLVAVPVMSLVIMPLLLCSLLSLPINTAVSSLFIELAGYAITPLWQFLVYCASSNSSLLTLTTIQTCIIILLCLIILFILLKPSFYMSDVNMHRRKWLVLPLIFMLSSFTFIRPKDESWQLYVLDVGQGLSVAVIKNGHVLVYDTGASYPSGFNFADTVIEPFLKAKDITSIDYLFVSHDDNDHAGGVAHLLERFPISHLVVNQNQLQSKAKQEACLAGKTWQWQGLQIKALHPNQQRGEDNDDSCVLHISDGQHDILFTGDISTKVEKLLVKKYQPLNIDILIAPHHGSKTSSSKAFIKWSSPDFVVFSTGFMNRWNMPNAQVKARFDNAQVTQLNTAEHGMITFQLTSEKINVINYRADITPYWFAN